MSKFKLFQASKLPSPRETPKTPQKRVFLLPEKGYQAQREVHQEKSKSLALIDFNLCVPVKTEISFSDFANGSNDFLSAIDHSNWQ